MPNPQPSRVGGFFWLCLFYGPGFCEVVVFCGAPGLLWELACKRFAAGPIQTAIASRLAPTGIQQPSSGFEAFVGACLQAICSRPNTTTIASRLAPTGIQQPSSGFEAFVGACLQAMASLSTALGLAWGSTACASAAGCPPQRRLLSAAPVAPGPQNFGSWGPMRAGAGGFLFESPGASCF